MSEVVVQAIEEYFRKHPNLKWKFGNMSLDGESTIKKLREDANFRDCLVKAVIKYSLERLIKGEE